VLAFPSGDGALRSCLAELEGGADVDTSAMGDGEARRLLDVVLKACPGVEAGEGGWRWRGGAGLEAAVMGGGGGEGPGPARPGAAASVGPRGKAASAPRAAASAGRGTDSVSHLLRLVEGAESRRSAAERSAVTATLGKVQGAGSGVWDRERYMDYGPGQMGRRAAGAGRGSLLQHLLGADEGATKARDPTLGGLFG